MTACAARTPAPAAVTAIAVEASPTAAAAPPTATTTSRPAEPTTHLPLPASPAPTALPTAAPLMEAPQNVILIVVDSLRSDHMSTYGYPRETTPNLDQLVAENGVRFTSAIATASWTCPSNASLFSGKMPGTVGATYANMGNSLPRRETVLAEYLDQAGFLTAGFVNNPCVSAKFGFSQGFQFFEDSFIEREDISTSNKVRAPEMNAAAIQWLEQYWVNAEGEKPRVFLFIYYMEPHVWHNPPAPFNTLFDPDYTGPITPELFGIGKEAAAGQLALSERDLQNRLALYDGEIAYWDSQLPTLINYLSQTGFLQDSLLIVTGDHGELMGEYGYWTHGTGLQEELLRVPLLMMYPGAIPAGTSVSSPVQMMDIMPTILDWVGLPIPADLQAISTRPLAQGGSQVNRPVFSEIDGVTNPRHWAYWQAPHEDLYAVIQDNWKLVVHADNPSLNELYYLNAHSPYEGENLIAREVNRAAALRQLIQQWFGK
jgi:arylsulfatase